MPHPGTSAPLVVDFGRSMNVTLVQRMLKISASGRTVAGTVAVGKQETEWRFTPNAPWVAGPYQLIVDTQLEDIAGNRIGQPFDIDVFDHVSEHLTTSTVSLPFSVR
jgi:hypothetical protein